MKTILFFLLFFANTLVAQNNAIYGSVGIGDAFYFGKFGAPVYEMAYERRFNSHWSVGLECSYRANSAPAVLTNEGLWVNGARQNTYYIATEQNKTLALTGFYTLTPAKSKHPCAANSFITAIFWLITPILKAVNRLSKKQPKTRLTGASSPILPFSMNTKYGATSRLAFV
jgi:hypothetical protein